MNHSLTLQIAFLSNINCNLCSCLYTQKMDFLMKVFPLSFLRSYFRTVYLQILCSFLQMISILTITSYLKWWEFRLSLQESLINERLCCCDFVKRPISPQVGIIISRSNELTVEIINKCYRQLPDLVQSKTTSIRCNNSSIQRGHRITLVRSQ